MATPPEQSAAPVRTPDAGASAEVVPAAPSPEYAAFELASALHESDVVSAARHAERALEGRLPASVQSRCHRIVGGAAEAAGNFPAAIRAYVLAHASDNSNLPAYDDCRRVLHRFGDPDAASMTWAFSGIPQGVLDRFGTESYVTWREPSRLPRALVFPAAIVTEYRPPLGEPPFNYCIEERLAAPATAPDVTVFPLEGAEFLYRAGSMHVLVDGELQRPLGTGTLRRQDLESTPLTRLAGTCCVVADYFDATNYAHWLLDWLPRIRVYDTVSNGGIDHYYVNDLSAPYRRDHLRDLGISLDRVVTARDAPRIAPDRLLFSLSCIAGHHPAHQASPWAIDFVRQLPGRDTGRPKRRLLLSRRDSESRRLVHEDETFARLASEFGFERLSLSEMSTREQAAAFRSAEAVVSVHGAGLANLVFCEEGTSVLELFSPVYGTPAFFQIAHSRNLRYWCLNGSDDFSEEPENLLGFRSRHGKRNVDVPPDRIVEIVSRMLRRAEG